METRTNKMEQKKETPSEIKSWTKKGDFSVPFHNGGNLYKSVTYINTEGGMEKIFFGGYLSSDSIRIAYSNNKRLEKALLDKCYNLQIPVEAALEGNVVLDSNNIKMITSFLDVLASVTSLSEKDKREMILMLPHHLKSEEFKSDDTTHWLKEGDFSHSISHFAGFNSLIIYKNLKSLKNEEKILMDARDNSFHITITYNNKNKKTVSAIHKECISKNIPVSYSIIRSSINLWSDNKKQLAAFVDVIDSVTPLGSSVKKEMRHIIEKDYRASKEVDDELENRLEKVGDELENISDKLEKFNGELGKLMNHVASAKFLLNFALFKQKTKENRETMEQKEGVSPTL